MPLPELKVFLIYRVLPVVLCLKLTVFNSAMPENDVMYACACVPRTGMLNNFPAKTFDVPSKPPWNWNINKNKQTMKSVDRVQLFHECHWISIKKKHHWLQLSSNAALENGKFIDILRRVAVLFTKIVQKQQQQNRQLELKKIILLHAKIVRLSARHVQSQRLIYWCAIH